MSRKNLQIQLALIFFSIMLIASACSFSITTLILRSAVTRQQFNTQLQIVSDLQVLLSQTDLTEEECCRILSLDSHVVSPADDQALEALGVQLQPGEVANLNLFRGNCTLVNLDGQVYEVTSHTQHGQQNDFYFLFMGMIISLFTCLLIGTAMMGTLTSRFLKPIRALNKATEQVAHGDFTVQVPVEDDGEMGRLTVKFNKMTRQLGSIETLRNDFVSNLSHEFKTPLAAISGFAHLLQDENLPPEERREYVDIIVKETDRLSHMSTNILRLSKLENQQVIPSMDDFSLDEQLRRCILMLESRWSEKQLEMDVELEPMRIVGSEELLQQVWINLIDNAIKFTPQGGCVRVSLERSGKQARVTVADTGIGMDGPTCEKVFDKFYQGNRTHASEGNGLGLALVKRIVELSEGSVSVTSKPGEGTAFTVTLPLPPAKA